MNVDMHSKWLTKRTAKIALYVSIGFFVVALVVLLVFPSIYSTIFRKQISLTEGTLATKNWQDIPFPIYERIYLFNISNAEDFVKKGHKLNVTQVGPYVYESSWVKPHLHWNPNGTVSYREIRTYHFKQNLSSGSEDDVIYTLNGPLVVASSILKKIPVAERLLASFLLKLEGEEVVIRRTVGQLTYAGYDDVIIKLAPLIKPDIPYKEGKFSWLYGKNATDDGLFTVFTGREDSSMVNIIDKFNGLDRLNFWNGDSCNMINGTSVETGPPLTDHQNTYTFFQSIFCRSLTYNYTSDYQLLGLDVKRFEPTYSMYANGSENPDNYCFDVSPGMASGVLNVSACQFGAEIFLSHPQFLMADPSFLEQINGLEPDNDLHSSFVSVEPITGLTVDFLVRLQLNVHIEPVYGILQLDNVRTGVFPVLWVELQGTIDQKLSDLFKQMLFGTKKIAYWTLGTVMVVSFLMIIASSVALFMIHKHEQNEDDPLLDPRECKANGPAQKTFGSNQTPINADANAGVQNQSLYVPETEGRFHGSLRAKDADDVAILNADGTSSNSG